MSEFKIQNGEQVSFSAAMVGRDSLIAEYTALSSVLEVVQRNGQILLTAPARQYVKQLVAGRLTELTGLLSGGSDD